LHLYPKSYYSKNEVKQAYKMRAKQTHPDVNKNESKAGALFQEVHASYVYLMRNAI